MTGTIGFGLSALMEASKHASEAQNFNKNVMEAMDSAVDDDLKAMVAGDGFGFDPEDTADAEMAGLGITPADEEKYQKLLSMIPEDDEDMESQIQEVTEGFFMNMPSALGIVSTI